MAEKTKKLKAELFQVRAQLERTSSVKLDEMLSLQKSASDRTGLGYDFSSPSIASTVFVPPTNNVKIENNNVKTDWVNYSKPTWGLARFHFTYSWFKTLHFAHLKLVPLAFRNPPLRLPLEKHIFKKKQI